MLVRFNKGPWHRKVLEVEDQRVQGGTINVAIIANAFKGLSVDDRDPNSINLAPGNKIAVYKIKMVRVNLRGNYEWLPSVFPDGPVCFEYERTY